METKIIGSKIAQARMKMNISQAQLAQRVFVSPQAVGKWERGESLPDIITLNRLVEIMSVDLDYFSKDIAPAVTETVVVQPLVNSPISASSGKQEKKLNWDMSRGNWVDADFSGLKNLFEKFSSSNMQRCKFNGSDLSGLLLKGNHVDGCDFSNSDISNSRIQASHITNAIFKNSILNKAEFSNSHIRGCDFTGADFTGVEVKFSSFEKNKMTTSVCNSTSFNAVALSDVVFEGKITDCYFENCGFTRVTFHKATLTNTFFKAKSLKGIKFNDCKADRMTYEFLKNGKADLNGIALLT